MPEFNHADRGMVHAEQTLWIVHSVLGDIENSGAWHDRIVALKKEVRDIAAELTTYNDQFESEA